MSSPFLGQITMFAGNFAPAGWALCDGGLLSVQQNAALFSLLGTTYGGDGRTTFGLPDLRGRLPVHAGQGIGISNIPIGGKGGGSRSRCLQRRCRLIPMRCRQTMMWGQRKIQLDRYWRNFLPPLMLTPIARRLQPRR